MTWNELTLNWNVYLRALAKRFPYADTQRLSDVKFEPDEMSRLLATSHDLTQREARDELENFLCIQSLARDTADLRSPARQRHGA